jgi:hypothetical protein
MFKKRQIHLTEEDIEEYKKKVDLIEDLKKVSSVYHIEMKENVTVKKLSLKFYINNLIMSAIMDAFYSQNEIDYKDINNIIYHRIPKWIWRLKITNYDNQKAISILVRLGFLIPIESVKKHNLIFKITDNGIKALQEQTFQNLAVSSFFSYQTYIMNRRSFWMTILMLIVTIMSVIVTISTLNR